MRYDTITLTAAKAKQSYSVTRSITSETISGRETITLSQDTRETIALRQHTRETTTLSRETRETIALS